MGLTPGKEIKALPRDTFVTAGDLESGSELAKRSALSHAVKAGELVRVRAGLYYKGRSTRFGMTHPAPADAVRAVLGTKGVGPAGYSAARHLGLTTQVPSELHMATVDRAREVVPAGVRLSSRTNVLRRDLNETEIALLEVLRDPKVLVETGWMSLVEVVRGRVKSGDVRIDAVRRVARDEHSKSIHEYSGRLWSEIALTA